MTMTRLFGLYGIKTGYGDTKLAALLDARGRMDADVAESARRKAEENRMAEEAAEEEAATERALDNALFSSIELPCRGLAGR